MIDRGEPSSSASTIATVELASTALILAQPAKRHPVSTRRVATRHGGETRLAARAANSVGVSTPSVAKRWVRWVWTVRGEQNRRAALIDAPPKAGSKLDDALDADGATAVLAAARGSRLEALAVLVLAVGLRQSEALNLHWVDVDLDKATVSVTTARTDVVSGPSHCRHSSSQPCAPTGSASSRKALPPRSDLVFPSTAGTRLDRRNVLRWWHSLTSTPGSAAGGSTPAATLPRP